jgi:hemolysin III
MGWLAVVAVPQLLRALPLPAIALIAAGGLAYSAGAVVYFFDDPDVRSTFGLHELWHVFVLVGSSLHFAAIIVYIT